MILNNQNERTKYKKALGWRKVTQKMQYQIDAGAEQIFFFYILIPLAAASVGGIATWMLWSYDVSTIVKFLPMIFGAIVGIVGSFIFRNYTNKVVDAVNREADEMTADVQIAGINYLPPGEYSEQYDEDGGVVRIEQKPIFRRKKNLTKVIKNGKVKFVSNSDDDQYDYFEPILMQKAGLIILVPKVLTEEEQMKLIEQKKKYGQIFGEAKIKRYNKPRKISIFNDKRLKEFGVEKVERDDILIPLSEFSTHMYIQGRAGSGKSVLYGKLYRATMGESGVVNDDGILQIKPDLEVLNILKEGIEELVDPNTDEPIDIDSDVLDILKKKDSYKLNEKEEGLIKPYVEVFDAYMEEKEQELIDALKCKNVVIDTKGDIYHKYFRGDFEIKNTDGTVIRGKDIMYAGGLDDNSIPYDISKDLYNDDGTLDSVGVQNFAEAIFKTVEITSDAERFWAVNGKNVTRAAITAIAAEGKLTNKNLYKWLKSNELVNLIKNNKEAAEMAGAAIEGKSDSERILGILSGITEKAIFLEWIANDRESTGDFSFKKWFNDGVPGTLYLVASDEIVDILMPLYGVITAFMLEAIFTREDKNPDDLPVHWFGDEMPKMGKISKIEHGLTFGRSKGLRMFPGVQNNLQLKSLYGEKYSSIVEGAGSKALFAQGGPESADFCSKFVGTSRVISKNNGVRMGEDGEEHTQNENRDNNYKEVLDSDFMKLQPTSFYLLGETGAYTKVSLNFNEVKQRREETKRFKLTVREAEIISRKRFTTEEDIDDEVEVEFKLDDLEGEDIII